MRNKLDSVRSQLPKTADRMWMWMASTADSPMLTVRFSADQDLSSQYDLLDRYFKKPIERLDGVARVELAGVEAREVRILVDPGRLAAHAVDIRQLVQLLEKSNFSVARRPDHRQRRAPVGAPARRIPLARRNTQPRHQGQRALGDVASVELVSPEITRRRHLDGRPAVGLDVFKSTQANVVEVVDRVLEVIEHNKALPQMQGIRVFTIDNQAEAIRTSLSDLTEAGLIGAALAFTVLFLFLRHWPTTLIVSASVPLSLLVTLAVMYFVGLTINVMSMMGMMLAIGMLVDNAVVVTESVFRHRQMDPENPQAATLAGVREVGVATLAGTATCVVVFLPDPVRLEQPAIHLAHTRGNSDLRGHGRLAHHRADADPHGDLALSCTAADGQQELDIAPAGSLYPHARLEHSSPRLDGVRIVCRACAHRWPHRAVESSSRENSSSSIRVRRMAAARCSSATTSRARIRSIAWKPRWKPSSVISTRSAAKSSASRVSTRSTTSRALSPSSCSNPAMRVGLKSQELIEKAQDGLPEIIIGKPSFKWDDDNSMGGARFSVQLTGESTEKLAELGDEVARVMSSVKGLEAVRSEAREGDEEVQIVVNRQRAAALGLTSSDVAQAVAAGMRGDRLREFRGTERELTLRLAFRESDRQTVDNLAEFPIYLPTGTRVPLSAVADFRIARGPRSIERVDRLTSVAVTGNVTKDSTLDAVGKDVEALMKNYQLPPGYTWKLGKGFDQQDENSQTMLFNLLLAIAMIYLVMAAVFESTVYPVSIITSIFMAIVGVIWLLFVTRTTVTLMAFIGVQILIGVVVNIGIVLVAHINELRSTGMERMAAIVQAGRDRLRPILMTTLTASLGLLPLAAGDASLAVGGGGPSYAPMARSIMGGLLAGAVMSLFVVPAFYVWIDNGAERVKRFMRRTRVADSPTPSPAGISEAGL